MIIKNLIKILIPILVFSISSCAKRLYKAEKFYTVWVKESQPISKNEFQNLDKAHQTVYRLYESFIDSLDNAKNRTLPNLKYLIIDQNLDVSICDSIIKTTDVFNRPLFKPINGRKSTAYIVSPRSGIPDITLLYFTNNYKKIIQKRKQFSTPSVYGFKKNKNVMAVFDGLVTYPSGRMRYDDLLFRIRSISISQDLKKAILQVDHNFGSVKIYYEYDDETNLWDGQRFDEWNAH